MPRVQLGRETRSCEHCGSAVERKVSQFRNHVFCSHKCYTDSEYYKTRLAIRNASRYAESRHSEPCLRCGSVVSRPVSQFNARTFCSRACKAAYHIETPKRQLTPAGYVLIFVGTTVPGSTKAGQIFEHRKVMQDFLGRPLLKEENVHHLNGIRHDNRLENLELWSRSQPSGQRVEDKIRWAKDFLALYEGVTPI